MLKLLTLWSLFTAHATGRVLYPLGGDPKTWSPSLDCTTCKVLIATLETDACLKYKNPNCTTFFEKYGKPEEVCEKLNICHIKISPFING